MRLLALDIETYDDAEPALVAKLEEKLQPNRTLKDEAKIIADLAQKRRKLHEGFALSPLTGQIVAIGYAEQIRMGPDPDEGRAWSPVEVMTAQAGGEIDLLEDFAAVLRSQRGGEITTILTWNGRNFDLPFLAWRAALHRVDLGRRLPLQDRRRHIDLKLDLGLGPAGFDGGLDLWATRFLGRGKSGEGCAVADLVLTGKWKELEAYCAEDVRLVCELADRLLPVIASSSY